MSMSVCEADETRHSNQFRSSELLESEIESSRQLAIARTPITNTSSLLCSRVKHGTDNHETRRDGPFTHPEDETDGEETRKVLASSMTTHSNSPDEYVQARGMPLQKMGAKNKVWATCLIHFPTGNLCSAKFCGNSKAK